MHGPIVNIGLEPAFGSSYSLVSGVPDSVRIFHPLPTRLHRDVVLVGGCATRTGLERETSLPPWTVHAPSWLDNRAPPDQIMSLVTEYLSRCIQALKMEQATNFTVPSIARSKSLSKHGVARGWPGLSGKPPKMDSSALADDAMLSLFGIRIYASGNPFCLLGKVVCDCSSI